MAPDPGMPAPGFWGKAGDPFELIGTLLRAAAIVTQKLQMEVTDVSHSDETIMVLWKLLYQAQHHLWGARCPEMHGKQTKFTIELDKLIEIKQPESVPHDHEKSLHAPLFPDADETKVGPDAPHESEKSLHEHEEPLHAPLTNMKTLHEHEVTLHAILFPDAVETKVCPDAPRESENILHEHEEPLYAPLIPGADVTNDCPDAPHENEKILHAPKVMCTPKGKQPGSIQLTRVDPFDDTCYCYVCTRKLEKVKKKLQEDEELPRRSQKPQRHVRFETELTEQRSQTYASPAWSGHAVRRRRPRWQIKDRSDPKGEEERESNELDKAENYNKDKLEDVTPPGDWTGRRSTSASPPRPSTVKGKVSLLRGMHFKLWAARLVETGVDSGS